MSHSQADKPYAAPMPAPTTIPVPASLAPPVTLTFQQKLIRFASSTVVVGGFVGIGYFAICRFIDRQWVVAFAAASASMMCIPLVDHSSSLRQRLCVSCNMTFAMAGLAVFVLLYFQLFYISWFERMFNDKGSGPVGLILFALCGLVAGGYFGWRMLSILGWPESSETVPAGRASSEQLAK